RPAAGAGTSDDLIETVAVDNDRSHTDAAAKIGVVGKQPPQLNTVGAAECAKMGPTAGIGASDDVVMAVAVQVARGHEDAAAEIGVIGKEVPDYRAGGSIENAHVRPAAGTSRRDNVV